MLNFKMKFQPFPLNEANNKLFECLFFILRKTMIKLLCMPFLPLFLCYVEITWIYVKIFGIY